MNPRALILISLIIIFAGTFGFLCYLNQGGIALKEAYEDGNVNITQITSAGTIPHQVLISTNSKKPVKVEKGTILSNPESEDLVIARDEIIPPEGNSTIPAYCIEPEQSAIKGSHFKVSDKAPWMIQEIIETSNPENPSEAFNTQLKIWLLARGANFNIYTGEVYYTVRANKMYFYQLKDNLSFARAELMTKFNLTEEQLNSININSTILAREENWLDKIMEFIGLK
ncbi:MAG TPA: hypothetical protein PLO64_05585 [Methanothermobacter sp.]|nr:conserved hypothetical protein [Methanothermobacter sp. MT-2]HHW05047.1 hypothetical protein [Methanothermobacter sp.]HOK72553.1 hypothetical protein [Methanothermobacter sp.]HOL69384.1 hypothetical protein [Methanothermobacter sp.]HPQ04040.1 hypothetical protein [Methanothermobacter sp.]